MAVAGTSAATPLPVGSSTFYSPATPNPLEVFSYKPANYNASSSHLLVVLHGAQRNAGDYRDAAKALANHTGALVVAPHFDSHSYSLWRYRTGGAFIKQRQRNPQHRHHHRSADGGDGDGGDGDGGADGGPTGGMHLVSAQDQALAVILYSCIAQVRMMESSLNMPYHFFAHSAGAQLLHRLLLFKPDDAVTSVVVANSGSYIMPDTTVEFPYGFGGLPPDILDPSSGSMTYLLKEFVERPMTMAVGNKDTRSDEPSLDKSDLAMKQGANRMQRAKLAFDTYKKLAEDKGWNFGWVYVEVPGVGHDGGAVLESEVVAKALAISPVVGSQEN